MYSRILLHPPQALGEKCRSYPRKWPNWPHLVNRESLDTLESAARGRCKSKRLYRRARFQACERQKGLSRGHLRRKGEKNNFTGNWLFFGNSLRLFEKVKKLFFAKTLKSKNFLTIRLAYRTRTEYVASNNRGSRTSLFPNPVQPEQHPQFVSNPSWGLILPNRHPNMVLIFKEGKS